MNRRKLLLSGLGMLGVGAVRPTLLRPETIEPPPMKDVRPAEQVIEDEMKEREEREIASALDDSNDNPAFYRWVIELHMRNLPAIQNALRAANKSYQLTSISGERYLIVGKQPFRLV